MTSAQTNRSDQPRPRQRTGLASTDTPALRLFSLLELIAGRDGFVSATGLIAETGLPKPTVYRMLGHLESAGLLLRQGDGHSYGTGARLREFAEALLLNATQHGARHAVLDSLVTELGETCNVTALSGNEVVYLDRVETSEPLRFYLRPGSRVPVHCSASGKMLLSQLTRTQQTRLLSHTPLRRFTPTTITDHDAFADELSEVAERGYAIDDEEFLAGLVCVAVLVPRERGRSNTCLAVQAPTLRLSVDNALEMLPALQRAAQSIAEIEAEGARG